MERLFAHMERFIRLGPQDRDLLAGLLRQKEVEKKTFLLKEGRPCNHNIFVLRGCLRMYYINDKGVEQIVQFGIDNWWITDYSSYNSGGSSQFFIQSVEASELVFWDRDKEAQLYAQVPQLERYFRLLLQRIAAAAQLRTRYMTDFSGEERYRHFAGSFPDFVQRVPQYMLASYLGFTPEFLSKIRAGKA